MGTKHNYLATWLLLAQLLYTSLCFAYNHELRKGFTAFLDPSFPLFQSIITDSTGNFSLGFLRVNSTQAALSVVHVPSYEQLWTANPTQLVRWAKTTRVSFNGSLLISSPRTGVFWSTSTDGDRVSLSSSSNLQIQKVDGSKTILWQSFDYPTDTLVENQNFTSTMALVSSNGLYSMRLGQYFMGLYAKFGIDSGPGLNHGRIYLKHTALEARAEIYVGQGPIYLVLKPAGYLGMYQKGTEPVDVQPFNTFNNPNTRSDIRIVQMESDGNLKGYTWSGSSWVLDFQAITDACELPNACGPYGLCKPGKKCSCIDTRKEFKLGGCGPLGRAGKDFCRIANVKYNVLRRNGLDLPNKEFMGYIQMGSWAQCEGMCEKNCKCWGVVYNNLSMLCYTLYYPMSMVYVGDESHNLGYFKVTKGVGKKG